MPKLLEKDLVYEIIGCAMSVHNTLGPGLREKTYENALCVELRHQGIKYTQQLIYPVLYREELVDEFIPDLVVEERVIVDVKTVEVINDIHRGIMLNYLRVSGIKVGILVNFKNRSLEWERLVLDAARL